ncbi:MAG: hypothetical protein ACJ75J_11920, partial [Cytophagaceae bacterium]
MKTKISFFTILAIGLIGLLSCKKDKEVTPAGTTSSTEELHQKYGEPTKSYTIHASSGGSFTTEKGTKVTIPANCFVNSGNQIISGDVTIHFKDITSKSEMLFSDMATIFHDGTPLVSGGEFFIQAQAGDTAVQIAAGAKIDIEQPFKGQGDTAMAPMILPKDTAQGGQAGQNPGWIVNQNNTVTVSGSSYVFSLYQFDYPLSAGTWCNSDNPYYFSAFTQTSLTVHCNTSYNPDVFLLFHDENSMIHVYWGFTGDEYIYSYAPIGKECTVVAVGYIN